MRLPCEIYDAEIDYDGKLYIAGYFTESVDFDPTEKTFELESAGGRNIFIAKYDISDLLITSAINPEKLSSTLKVYPVPVSEKIFIEAEFGKPVSGEIRLHEISGRILLKVPFINETQLLRTLPVQIPSGVIIVKVITNSENFVKKVIVQR
jgi:hypothetical protein